MTGAITDLQDKGPGKHAIFSVAQHAVDVAGGARLVTCDSTFVLRGAGGFGGERAPTKPIEALDRARPPSRRPDSLKTKHCCGRLSGDRNPPHSDPGRDAASGLPRPILHGLCTYGFAVPLCCRRLRGRREPVPGGWTSGSRRRSCPEKLDHEHLAVR